MGRQVNFFMDQADESRFLDFVRAKSTVRIFPFQNQIDRPEYLETLPVYGTPNSYSYYLLDLEITPELHLKSVEQQPFFVPDAYSMEIIEFSRSGVGEQGLRAGRLWAETTYWDLRSEPPQLQRKSEALAKWYERLARWIKKQSVRTDSFEWYLPGAAGFIKTT